ncbi:hypothetical protein Tco_0680348 [Tanacetum coccineum]|uniref:Uncharacterized protein n=1 Tax=Tanacetum coccineum TaxID=301880 RepID=A0ABQ4XK98_9ASTR
MSCSMLWTSKTYGTCLPNNPINTTKTLLITHDTILLLMILDGVIDGTQSLRESFHSYRYPTVLIRADSNNTGDLGFQQLLEGTVVPEMNGVRIRIYKTAASLFRGGLRHFGTRNANQNSPRSKVESYDDECLLHSKRNRKDGARAWNLTLKEMNQRKYPSSKHAEPCMRPNLHGRQVEKGHYKGQVSKSKEPGRMKEARARAYVVVGKSAADYEMWSRVRRILGSLACIKADEKKLNESVLSEDFQKYFSDSVGLPHVREVEFSIRYDPGAITSWLVLYTGLAFRNVRIVEQLKDFKRMVLFDQVHFTWGSTCALVKRRTVR